MTHGFTKALGWVTLASLATALCVGPARAQGGPRPWPQWGGPDRNFITDTKGLSEKWPESGPEKLWSRELGDGYSTIVAEDGRLYTMYRKGEEEFVVCLDAKTGKNIWEQKYESKFTDLMAQFGAGPHATPLIVGERLFTAGANVVLHAFDLKTGEILWKRDLVADFEAHVPGRGYSCSPVAYGDTITLPVGGGEGESIMAFKQSDGSVAWKKHDFEVSHASPIIIEFDGKKQLVCLMNSELVGLDPGTGDLIWKHETQPGANISSPVWTGGNLIFCSAAYESGSRAVELTREDDAIVPKELWYTRKMRIHHGNAIRIGDYVYASSGQDGPAFLMGMNIKTGELAWRERGFSKANLLCADGKIIILDEDGDLALATMTPDGLTVHSRCHVAERTAWAAPTLIGTTLYVRDRMNIMAFDLG